MLEQYKYHTITEDIKSLIQYVQHYATKHPVIEAANRLNKAIKKNVDVGLIPIKVHEGKDSFEEEKQQYAEDCKTHEKPWELWQWAPIGKNPDCEDWKQLKHAPSWWHKSKYRRKPTTFNPEYYSGLNWRNAEHLIGKTVECTTNPDCGWAVGTLKIIAHMNDAHFGMTIDNHTYFYNYIRTCEETVQHQTINIGGVELPMPETVEPALGTQYWLSPACNERVWGGSYHINALQAGQVHLTEERAKAWADWWKKEVLAKIKEIAS